MTIESLLIIAAVFLAAGAVKGISGMGLPTISMAILGLLMPPAKAAMLMVMPSLATNLTQCLGKPWRSLVKRFWPMWTSLLILIVFSPLSSIDKPGGHATLILGIVLVIYGTWGLFKPVLPNVKGHPVLAGLIVGSLSGIVTAATGVFVIPMVPYLQSLSLPKEIFIQALGISFTVATVGLSIKLGVANAGDLGSYIPESGTAMCAAFAGLWCGTLLRGRLNPLQFQRALYSVFVVLGLLMAYKNL